MYRRTHAICDIVDPRTGKNIADIIYGEGPPPKPSRVKPKVYSESECCICTDAPSTRVVVPCGHLCMCFSCSEKYTERCPICRCDSIEIVTLITTVTR